MHACSLFVKPGNVPGLERSCCVVFPSARVVRGKGLRPKWYECILYDIVCVLCLYRDSVTQTHSTARCIALLRSYVHVHVCLRPGDLWHVVATAELLSYSE